MEINFWKKQQKQMTISAGGLYHWATHTHELDILHHNSLQFKENIHKKCTGNIFQSILMYA